MRSSQHSLIGVLLMLFSSRMISEVVQPFWAALQRGEFITGAAESVGSYRVQGRRWIVAAGGVRPRRGRDLQGRYLSFSEREEIAVALAAGESIRAIARRLGRSPSTVSRELRRNAEHRVDYRARTAALNARSGRSVQPLSGRDTLALQTRSGQCGDALIGHPVVR